MFTDVGAALGDLPVLQALAQAGSFTRAAQRLGLAKATVSLRIATLERSVGVALVRRTTRSVMLTPAGQQLLDEAGPALARIAQSLNDVRELVGEPRGLVRVTAPVALGRQHLVRPLAALLQRYPELRVELLLDDRLVNLTNEGFDLAIRHTHQPDDGLVATPLCASRSLLVASADYLKRRGIPRHPRDLAAHHCLLYPRGAATQRWVFDRQGVPEQESVAVDVSGNFKVNNSEALRDAVLAGLGIGLLPDFSAMPNAATRGLRRVLPDWQPRGAFGGCIYAVRPWAARMPKAVQCLLEAWREALREGFGAPPAPGGAAAPGRTPGPG